MADKEQEPPQEQDYAEILRRHFATVQNTGDQPRYQMSQRNQRKLDKIRERVKQLRGQV